MDKMIINGVNINEHERVDDLHRNGYLLIQDPKRFCFGIDAVILSDFCKVHKNEKVLDLGTGTGVIPILLAGKTKGKHFTGLEIQQESVEMAKRSVLLNNLQDKIRIDEGDLKKAIEIYGHASFDVICSNPPYMNAGSGMINNFTAKAAARHEILCTLDDVIKNASSLLKYGGRFYMIHRPQRITDILCLLRLYKLEAKIIRFVHAYINKSPILILVEAHRGGNSSAIIKPPLIIYDENGQYTSEYTSGTEV